VDRSLSGSEREIYKEKVRESLSKILDTIGKRERGCERLKGSERGFKRKR
jgi:hypothetical protein